MPLMRRAVSLHMEWCLDCHRHPETAVRHIGEQPAAEQSAVKSQLTDCVICHR
jgi:hypothetical protein